MRQIRLDKMVREHGRTIAYYKAGQIEITVPLPRYIGVGDVPEFIVLEGVD